MRLQIEPYRDTTLEVNKLKYNSHPQREVEEVEEVRNVRLLLDVSVSSSGKFWQLWPSNIHKLLVKHAFYQLVLDWDFWSTLLGCHANGWLESSVIFFIFKLYL